MQIPILVEPVTDNGYRARIGEPFGLVSEGATPDEAVQKLRELVANRLAAGCRIVPLEVPEAVHPWAKVAGIFKDDPLFDEWQQAIAEYRRQIDEDPSIP